MKKGTKKAGSLLVLASAVFLCAAVKEESPYLETEAKMDRLRTEFTLRQNPPEHTDACPERVIDFEGLKRRNADIIGWISIPGTPVDYPVLRNPYDNYYLDHDIDGNANEAGAVFVQQNTDVSFQASHTVLYGHNLKDGQMFGWLPRYREPGVREAHPEILLYLPGKSYTAEIYSVYECPDASETYQTAYPSQEAFADWIRMTKTSSLYDVPVAPEADSRILTLSTCTNQGDHARLVVHAVIQEAVGESR